MDSPEQSQTSEPGMHGEHFMFSIIGILALLVVLTTIYIVVAKPNVNTKKKIMDKAQKTSLVPHLMFEVA